MFESEELKYHEGRLYGIYRAYVYDNKDPDNMGRLRLCIPSALGEDDNNEPIISDWAYPAFPIAGDKWGIQNIPRVENPDGSKVLVWVAFEMGDPDYPVWFGSPIPEGGLIKEVQKNHAKNVKGKTRETCWGLTTPNGHKIILDDTNQCIIISSSDKNGKVINTINVDSKKDIILIETETNTISINKSGIKFKSDDKNKVQFSIGGTSIVFDKEKVNIETDTFAVTAGDAKLNMEDGKVTISVAGTTLNLAGSSSINTNSFTIATSSDTTSF